jgi:hypothetical protein
VGISIPQTDGQLSALTSCNSSLAPNCRKRLPNIAGRPTARRLHRAAHKNSDQDNEAGSVAHEGGGDLI